MPSYLNSLRMKSLFGPSQSSTPGMSLPKRFVSGYTNDFNPDESPEQTDANNYFSDLERMRSEASSGPARSAYTEALERQPREAQYPASKKRKFGGVLAAIGGTILNGGVEGGMDAYDRVSKGPYHKAMKEWEVEMGGKTQAAKFEEADINARMKNLADARRLGLDYSEYRRKVEKDMSDYGVEMGKLGETRRRNTMEGRHWDRGDTTSEAGQRDTAGYRRRTADTGDFNAQTSRMGQQTQFGLGMGRLNNERERTRLYGDSIKNKQPSSVQQAYARDNAFAELYNNPSFRPFIRREADGRFNYEPDITQTQMNSLMYREFRTRMKAAIDNAKGSGNPVFPLDEEEDDDGSIIIGPPTMRRR